MNCKLIFDISTIGSDKVKIAIGKIGKSIFFGKDSSIKIGKKAMTAGSIDAKVIFETLIKYNPQHQFYIVGRSNYSRLSDIEQAQINMHGNVVDLWKESKEWLKDDDDELTESYRYIDYILSKNRDFDCGIFIAGGVLEYAVQGKTLDKDGNPIKTLMAANKYAGPIHHFINETKLKYLMLVTDPRCYPKPTKDLMVVPKRILSQYNEIVEVEHRISYESPELVIEKVPAVYSGIESLYLVEEEEKPKKFSLMGKPKTNNENITRDINMVLFLNEGNPSRYKDVMDYVLSDIKDAVIYGSWSDSILKKHPQFQNIPMAELSHLFSRIKYTFCIPIKPGWATGKFWDMIRLGIVPFVHPTYDEQRNIGFPEFLRVYSSKELVQKIEFLNSHPEEYDKLVKELNAMITPDKKNGSYLNSVIMKHLNEIMEEK